MYLKLFLFDTICFFFIIIIWLTYANISLSANDYIVSIYNKHYYLTSWNVLFIYVISIVLTSMLEIFLQYNREK